MGLFVITYDRINALAISFLTIIGSVLASFIYKLHIDND